MKWTFFSQCVQGILMNTFKLKGTKMSIVAPGTQVFVPGVARNISCREIEKQWPQNTVASGLIVSEHSETNICRFWDSYTPPPPPTTEVQQRTRILSRCRLSSQKESWHVVYPQRVIVRTHLPERCQFTQPACVLHTAFPEAFVSPHSR